MATAPKSIPCQSCGYAKNPPGSVRCVSCGLKLEELVKDKASNDTRARSYQQEGVSPTWLAVAVVVQALLTCAIVFGLPMLVPLFDFEGGSGMAVCVPVWFAGGFVVGLISPGRTFVEPTLASFLVAMPVTYLLVESQTVHVLPTFLYVVLAGIGVMFTLIGAYAGERVQVGPTPQRATT